VNFVDLKIFYPDLIDKTKTPQYTLVSIPQLHLNIKWQFNAHEIDRITRLLYNEHRHHMMLLCSYV